METKKDLCCILAGMYDSQRREAPRVSCCLCAHCAGADDLPDDEYWALHETGVSRMCMDCADKYIKDKRFHHRRCYEECTGH